MNKNIERGEFYRVEMMVVSAPVSVEPGRCLIIISNRNLTEG